MHRRIIEWRIGGGRWTLGLRTLICGVVNVSPESRVGAGRYQDPDAAAGRLLEMAAEGADVLEIATEHWSAGSARLQEAEELRRLVPVLKRLKGQLTVPLCVETWRSQTALKAIEHGAAILRDPTGLVLDPGLAKVAAQHDTGLVLAHMRGQPEDWARQANIKDPVGAVLQDLDASIGRATIAGVLRHRLVLDPGLGMGKRKEQNIRVLAELPRLVAMGLPVMLSLSGQTFATEPATEATLPVSLAAGALAVRSGVHLLRVSEVAAHREAALLADASFPEEPAEPAPRPAPAKRAAFGEDKPRRPVRPGLRSRP